MGYLPITTKEIQELGWDYIDFIYINGDAYIDHPSFGCAIITRTLESFGYRCAIISQPNIGRDSDFTKFGKPRLGFLVSSGNIDSMVNHYSVSKKKRSKDFYTPNSEMGKRPDRAVIKYCNKLRSLYPDTPILIGGIEASLRRLSHYDYWSDSVMKSILLDSKADLLMYGMGERTVVEVADALNSGMDIKDIIYIKNTVWKTVDSTLLPTDGIYLPDYEIVKKDKMQYAESFLYQYKNHDPVTSKPLIEKYEDCYVVQNIPDMPLTPEEMDNTYNLPYMRDVHPLIEAKGHVPAIDEVKFSISMNRGCFGNCSFCALTFHQGRIVQSRSKESILAEAKLLTTLKGFKGYINDIGGPTANFYNPACNKQINKGLCGIKNCIGYTPCKNLIVSHMEYLDILRNVRKIPGIKKVFVRSGIRYDYIMYDKNKEFFNELVKYHTSGQLRVAPEHIDDNVLKLMNKPSRELYDKFVCEFYNINEKNGLNQYVVPYLISSHPGSTLDAAINLAVYLHENNINPEQVQDFYPTPSTLSTCMYYTGINPLTGEKIYVCKNPHEKRLQRALIQYKDPANYDLIKEALIKGHRTDLIGYDKKCLIRPRNK